MVRVIANVRRLRQVLKRATAVSLKLLACYLVANAALVLYAVWPNYRLGEMVGVLAAQPRLILGALPLLILVPSMEGNERFVGSLIAFVLAFGVGALYAFWPSKKTPNTAMESDTYSAPLRAPSGAPHRER